MQVVCEATQNSDERIQLAAFECLVRVMHLYYDKMRFYMEKALFGVKHQSTFPFSFTKRMLLTVCGCHS